LAISGNSSFSVSVKDCPQLGDYYTFTLTHCSIVSFVIFRSEYGLLILDSDFDFINQLNLVDNIELEQGDGK